MHSYRLRDIHAGIQALPVLPGQTVIVWSDLTMFGSCVDVESKQELLQTFLDAFLSVLGDAGTLVVPTWNTDIASSGEPFSYEDTPSRAGVFSEYVRTRPGAVRSLHPLVSYCALGRRADEVCGNISRNAYGLETPFDRLIAADAVAVSLGLPARRTCSIVHHAEMMLGVPYRYHKELTIEVRKGGKILEGCFYLYVRNLKANIQKDGNRKLFERFHDLGYALHSSKIGGGVIEAYRFSELFRAAVALLKEDPYGFLEHPPEVRTYQE